MSSEHDNKAAAEKPAAHPADGVATPANAPAVDAERLATLERENADLKDRLLRSLADMENLRRRTEREVQDQRTYAVTKFATDIVGTADNLRRALEAVPKADDSQDNSAIKALVDGVELTERELLKTLERHGVKKREPVGERFDPHKDQAVFEIPDEKVPTGTVLQVMQAGYTIGDRVLRPSMVGVSKGGPARAPAPEAEAKPAETKPAEAPHKPHADPGKPKVDKQA